MEDTVHWTITALREMLPRPCGVWCTRLESPPDHLTGEEVGRMKGVGDARRSNFIAGRNAAHEALAQLGVHASAIPSGPRGEPIWPEGMVGTIAHAGGVAAAAAARSDAFVSLGLDIEVTGAVTCDVWSDVLRPSEIAFVNSQSDKIRAQIATALFCTKEAFYKFQYPQTDLWLEFKEAEVMLEPASNRCRLTLDRGITIGGQVHTEFPGQYRIGKALTIAAISWRCDSPL